MESRSTYLALLALTIASSASGQDGKQSQSVVLPDVETDNCEMGTVGWKAQLQRSSGEVGAEYATQIAHGSPSSELGVLHQHVTSWAPVPNTLFCLDFLRLFSIIRGTSLTIALHSPGRRHL